MNISKKPFSHKQTPWKGSLTSPELPCPGDGEGESSGTQACSWQEKLLQLKGRLLPARTQRTREVQPPHYRSPCV